MKHVYSLPQALDKLEELTDQCKDNEKEIVFFLDYDGTLSPIVEDPEKAYMSNETKNTLAKLCQQFTTAIVSGRANTKVRKFVNLDSLYYAGSHGLDISGPNGSILNLTVAVQYKPQLVEAAKRIQERLVDYDKANLEDNSMAFSIHYRCSPDWVPERLRKMVEEVLQDFPALQLSDGKMVYEVKPKVDWNKGKAVDWLLEGLGLKAKDVLPIYIGDDVTDEDAFEALRGRGVGVIVADGSQNRTTFASARLRDTVEVQMFLDHFADNVPSIASSSSPPPAPSMANGSVDVAAATAATPLERADAAPA